MKLGAETAGEIVGEPETESMEMRIGAGAVVREGTQRAFSCPLQTFGARFIVEPAEDEGERRIGNIVIPQTANLETHAEGVVVSVGDGLLLQDGGRVALPVELGDTVLYRKHAGAVVKREGREWVVLDLENLLAVVR